jgi:hypothetical protein
MLTQILVAIVAFVLVYYFLIPLLPAPFGAIALIVLIVAVIVWLLRLVGIN